MLRAAVPSLADLAVDEPAEPAEAGPAWAPTRAMGRAVLLVGLLLLTAALLGRIDLVVLAAPLAIGVGLALRHRPSGAPVVRIDAGDEVLTEGGTLSAVVQVGNPDQVPYDLAVVRTSASRYLRIPHVDRPYVTAVPAGTSAEVTLRGQALRWGRVPFGPAVAHAVTGGGLLVSAAAIDPAHRLRVYPVTEGFDADDAMPRAAGLIGTHRSRRPGEGGELAGVRMFSPGDRLRRIDWRVSLRTRELHVAATLSERDAEVVLLLDVLHEAGRSGGLSGTTSVLDTTVRAAAGIAEHYLHRGDRVAMLEYGFQARWLRAAGGRRQYLTVLEWLLDVDAAPHGFEPSPSVFGPHLMSPDALIVVLTPVVDQRSAAMVARLARSGRFVVAVDTFPPGLALPRRATWGTIPGRLWKLERDNILDLLREHGVPVVAWAGAGSLDAVLRQIARLAGAPRVALR